MAWKLADLFVEFSLKGVTAVQKAFEGVQTQMEGVKKGAEAVANAAESAFGKAKLGVMGFATAGLAASSAGQILAFQMERLSRTVAGLFGPEIYAAINGVQRLTDWINSLSNAQKTAIAHWLEGGLAALTFASILPKVFGGIQLVIGGVKALTAALTLSGWGAVLPVLGAIVSGLGAFGAASKVGRDGVGGLLGAMQGLGQELGKIASGIAAAFEPLRPVAERIFERLATTAALLGPILLDLAQAFEPIIEAIGNVLIPLLDGLNLLLQTLGAEVVKVAAAWLAGVGTYRLLISVIPAVISGIMAIVNAIRTLNVALAIKNALEGPTGWVKLAAAVVAAGVAVSAFNAMEPKEKKFKVGGKVDGSRGALAPHLGGMTNLAAMYDRLAEASRLSGQKTEHEEAQDLRRKQLEETQRTNQILSNQQGPIGK